MRGKRIVLEPSRWHTARAHRDPIQAAEWFVEHQGDLYDWQLIAGQVAWVIPHKASRRTCSEAVAEALGYEDPWRYDPCVLHSAVAAEDHYRSSLLWLAGAGEEAAIY